MKLVFLRILALIGFFSCIYAAAEVGVVANYHTRVEESAQRWCGKTSYCAAVRREGGLASPSLRVELKERAPSAAAVENAMRTAGALNASRRAEDPEPRPMRLTVVIAGDRAAGRSQ